MITLNEPFTPGKRHSKITGDLGEELIMYLLSKKGYICAKVDYVGIDILAKDKESEIFYGISVKSRSRTRGQKGESLNIPTSHFKNLISACQEWTCKPYFALLIDEQGTIFLYLLSEKKYSEIATLKGNKSYWKMSKKMKELYKQDSDIISLEFSYK